MFEFNPLIGLIVRVTGVGLFVFMLILQIRANNTPPDQFTGTRVILTALISSVIIFTSPSVAYLIIRSTGGESELVRAISTVCGSMSFIFTALLLLILYLQKEK